MRGAFAVVALLVCLRAAAQQPMPAVGDQWTYRLSPPGQESAARTYVVTVGAVSRTEILDQVVIDGGRSVATRHSPGAQMLGQSGGVFSPYLLLLDRRTPVDTDFEVDLTSYEIR